MRRAQHLEGEGRPLKGEVDRAKRETRSLEIFIDESIRTMPFSSSTRSTQ
jgi:hypothetical protein